MNKYWMGMTKEQAKVVLGEPRDINKTGIYTV